MVMFDNFFFWLLIACLVIAISKTITKIYGTRTKNLMFNAMFDGIQKGVCYVYKPTKGMGRPKYSVIVGKEYENKEYILQYKTVTYDSFFIRYEESEITFKDTMQEFFKKYEKSDITVDYFKYEKFV